ncbi:hypothetical protein D6774_02950 [Candidatus Woesearchaeota archaeon]|nr:MAG: hypothetical protein D6774_02950 [Candidatus Woesearchaeota archaeon]
MKVLHLHAPTPIGEIDFDTSPLPKRIGIIGTIQTKPDLERVKEYLESKGHEAFVGGQVLGCDQNAALAINRDVDAFLFVGSGYFHPVGIAHKFDKICYTWRPGEKTVDPVPPERYEEIEKRKRGMLAKFYSSDVIGVLMSCKSGQATVQSSLKKIFELQEQYPEKQFYFFAYNTFDFGSLEDFNFVQCWINTQCPRIREDLKVLNIEDLTKASYIHVNLDDIKKK